MKKLFFIWLAVMNVATGFAAEAATDTVGVKEAKIDTVEALWRDGGKFYAGETLLSKQAYKNLLRNTCPDAFREYNTGDKLITAGWSVFGVGAGVFAIGTGLIVANIIVLETDPSTEEVITSPLGIAIGMGFCWPIAGGLMLTSTPLLAVGYTKRNKSVDMYNASCHVEPPITYHVTAGQNGLGFAVRF